MAKNVKIVKNADLDLLDEIHEEESRHFVNNKKGYVFGVMVHAGTQYSGAPKTKACVLYPGVNQVRSYIWNEAKKNPCFEEALRGGDIVDQGDTPYKKLSVKEKIRVVSNVFDKRLLNHLKHETIDSEVLREISKQIEAIDGGGRLSK